MEIELQQPPTVSNTPVEESVSIHNLGAESEQRFVSDSSAASEGATVVNVFDDDSILVKSFDINPSFLISLPQQAIRAIVFLLVGFFILANALNYTNGRMPSPSTHPTLPDIGFDITPKYDIEYLTNVCVGVLNVLTIFTVYKLILFWLERPLLPIFPTILLENSLGKFLLCPPEADIHRLKFLEAFIRWAATYGSMLYVRSIVITVTVLPATDNHCKNPIPIENWWQNVMMTMLTLGGGSIHCGDLLFSGHMTIITVSTLSTICYGRFVCRLFPYAALVPYFASWFTIVSSRSHYTDDIVVATALTGLIYAVLWMGGESPEPSALQSIRGAPLWLQCVLAPVSGYRYLRGKRA